MAKSELNWAHFKGESFQHFCNALIQREISKHVRVYTAPGRDQGFDAEYDGKEGKWRFQAKCVGKNKISQFKRKVKEDILSNFSGERYIVYTTNLRISNGKQDEILAMAQDLLPQDAVVEFQLWDAGTLESKLVNYPVIHQWYWPDVTNSLVPYRDYFRSQLDETRAGPFQMTNPFLGREAEIQRLMVFLENEDAGVCSIVAPGGYGKTRLCLRFFEEVVDASEDWRAYVVSKQGFTISDIQLAIGGEEKMVILVDDAHGETKLNGIIDAVGRPEMTGRIKLLLTTRSPLFSDVQDKFSSHAEIRRDIILQALNRDDTYLAALGWLHAQFGVPEKKSNRAAEVQNLAVEMMARSAGVPIVLTTLMFGLSKQKSFAQIFESTEEFDFADWVWRFLRQEIKFLSQQTMVSEKQVLNCVRYLSLFSYSPLEAFEPLVGHLEISEGEWENIRKGLVGAGFLDIYQQGMLQLVEEGDKPIWKSVSLGRNDKRDFFAIRPDPYKDIILAGFISEKSLIRILLKKTTGRNRLENVFRNLTPLIEISASNTPILEAIFEIIPEKLLNDKADAQYIKTVANLAASYFQKLPNFHRNVFVKVLEILELFRTTETSENHERLVNDLKPDMLLILKEGIIGDELDSEKYDLLARFARVTQDPTIIAEQAKHRRNMHALKTESFQKPLFIFQKLRSSLTAQNAEYALQFFSWIIGWRKDDSWGAFYEVPFSYDRFLNTDTVKSEIRTEIIDEILRIADIVPEMEKGIIKLCFAFLDSFEEKQYVSVRIAQKEAHLEPGLKRELDLVAGFLCPMAARRDDFDFRIWLRDNMSGQYLAYLPPEVKDVYIAISTELEKFKSIGERLALSNYRWFQGDAQRENDTDAILASLDSPKLIAESLLELKGLMNAVTFRKSNKTLWWFLWRISILRAVDPIALLPYMLKNHPELLWEDEGCLLKEIGFGKFANEGKFSHFVDRLLAYDSVESLSMILRAYPSWRKLLKLDWPQQADLETIERIVSRFVIWGSKAVEDTNSIHWPLTNVMLAMVRIIPVRALDWSSRIFDFLDAHNQNLLILWLIKEDDDSINPTPEISDFVWEKGPKIDLFSSCNLGILEFLSHLGGSEGIDGWLRFAIRCLQERKKRQLDFKPLSHLDHHHYFRRNGDLPPLLNFHKRERYKNFQRVLNWFVDPDFENELVHLEDAWQLVQVLIPQDYHNPTIEKTLRTAAENFRTQPKSLLRLAMVHFHFMWHGGLPQRVFGDLMMELGFEAVNITLSEDPYGPTREFFQFREALASWKAEPEFLSERELAFIEGILVYFRPWAVFAERI